MTLYEIETQRQKARAGIPQGHIAAHRWYLRHDEPKTLQKPQQPQTDITIMAAKNPTVAFYRFLYHTVGEDYLWGDRRRMSDEKLHSIITAPTTQLMVLYQSGVPAGFYELDFSKNTAETPSTDIAYFGLLPGFTGAGLGGYLLVQAVKHAATGNLPVTLNTCTLDHPAALENYQKCGFKIISEEDYSDPDPRLDGTIIASAAKHIPLPKGA